MRVKIVSQPDIMEFAAKYQEAKRRGENRKEIRRAQPLIEEIRRNLSKETILITAFALVSFFILNLKISHFEKKFEKLNEKIKADELLRKEHQKNQEIKFSQIRELKSRDETSKKLLVETRIFLRKEKEVEEQKQMQTQTSEKTEEKDKTDEEKKRLERWRRSLIWRISNFLKQ